MKLTKEFVEDYLTVKVPPLSPATSDLCDDWLAMRAMLEELNARDELTGGMMEECPWCEADVHSQHRLRLVNDAQLKELLGSETRT